MSHAGLEAQKRKNLVKRGLAEPLRITTTLREALEVAGLEEPKRAVSQ